MAVSRQVEDLDRGANDGWTSRPNHSRGRATDRGALEQRPERRAAQRVDSLAHRRRRHVNLARCIDRQRVPINGGDGHEAEGGIGPLREPARLGIVRSIPGADNASASLACPGALPGLQAGRFEATAPGPATRCRTLSGRTATRDDDHPPRFLPPPSSTASAWTRSGCSRSTRCRRRTRAIRTRRWPSRRSARAVRRVMPDSPAASGLARPRPLRRKRRARLDAALLAALPHRIRADAR